MVLQGSGGAPSKKCHGAPFHRPASTPRGGLCPPTQRNFVYFKVKCINLVHSESKLKRLVDLWKNYTVSEANLHLTRVPRDSNKGHLLAGGQNIGGVWGGQNP